MKTEKLTRCALLTAAGLALFIVELQIPPLAPIPGVKLGLANIVTVYAMFALGPAEAGAILLCRIMLGAMFSGSIMTVIYSLAGGCLCYLAMAALRPLLDKRQIWAASVVGAVAHNCGQMAAAVAVTSTPGLVIYLPLLIMSGMAAGLFTGLCAQYGVNRLGKKGNR